MMPIWDHLHEMSGVIVDVDRAEKIFGIELVNITEETIALAKELAATNGLLWPDNLRAT
jgi:uncharacterized protein YuzE